MGDIEAANFTPPSCGGMKGNFQADLGDVVGWQGEFIQQIIDLSWILFGICFQDDASSYPLFKG